MPGELRVEAQEPGVTLLTLSHPERKGAITHGMLQSLDAALDAAVRGAARVVLVRGEGGAFSAGYDLSTLDAPASDGLPDTYLGQVLTKLQRLPIPTVALVEGPAFGAGCELACACDLRVGDTRARFCMPPARLGIVYSLDGLARVARLVGLQRARRMFLTADRIDAQDAHAWGLLDLLAEEGKAAEQAAALARVLAAMSPLAIAGMKEGFALLETPAPADAERQRHASLRRAAFESKDAAEGIAAFLERRPAKFEGK
jgi:enoyl-CoA hydratase/carnithine racemase